MGKIRVDDVNGPTLYIHENTLSFTWNSLNVEIGQSAKYSINKNKKKNSGKIKIQI